MTINLIDIARRRKIASHLAIVLITFVGANSASAESRRIQVGTLTCSLSSSIGMVNILQKAGILELQVIEPEVQ
jgi:hypothetical protein